MKSNFDFRLNKAEIIAFVDLVLDSASQNASILNYANVDYVISPGKKITFKYGNHHNAQEVNIVEPMDYCEVEVDCYKNGKLFCNRHLILRFNNYFIKNISNNYFNDVIDPEKLKQFYYAYMYYLFGENYKIGLIEQLNTNKFANVSELNKKFHKYMQNKHNSSAQKASYRYNYRQILNQILDYYQTNVDWINNLDNDFLKLINN